MKRLVIFDLDGTLVDTIDDLAASANHALAGCGYPQHDPLAYRAFVGNGVLKLIERALPTEARNEAEIQRVRDCMVAHYDRHDTERSRPYPGVHELLRELVRCGVMVAVASNKYNRATRRIVAHFFPDIPFVAVFGQRKNVKIKPDPMVVRHVLKVPAVKAVGIGADETLMVGDSAVDIETARAAGIGVVAVSWGFSLRGDLEQASPNHIVDRAEELLKFL